MAVTRADVLSYLEKSNIVEISELVKEIEEKFGVSAAAPVAVAATAPAAAAEKAEADEMKKALEEAGATVELK
jgi:large subunit ribosomal protein L7/L12